ncbi:MAG: hypothetical protein V4644_02845 [Patescibacteria group bacterium]
MTLTCTLAGLKADGGRTLAQARRLHVGTIVMGAPLRKGETYWSRCKNAPGTVQQPAAAAQTAPQTVENIARTTTVLEPQSTASPVAAVSKEVSVEAKNDRRFDSFLLTMLLGMVIGLFAGIAIGLFIGKRLRPHVPFVPAAHPLMPTETGAPKPGAKTP